MWLLIKMQKLTLERKTVIETTLLISKSSSFHDYLCLVESSGDPLQ